MVWPENIDSGHSNSQLGTGAWRPYRNLSHLPIADVNGLALVAREPHDKARTLPQLDGLSVGEWAAFPMASWSSAHSITVGGAVT